MTSKEAIEVLQTALTAPFIYGAYADAIDMAIEALTSQNLIEPNNACEVDLISRQDAFGAVQDHFNADGFKGYFDGQKMMDRIKALPSAKGGDAQMNEVNPKQYMQQSPNGADLISRQDAINTLETEERNTDRAEDVSGLTLAKFLIDALPSADAVSREAIMSAKFHPLPYTHITPTDADAESYKRGWNDALDAVADNAPSAEAVQGWIPFTRRPMTEEEQKDYPNCTFMFDCVLPDDGDEILVSNGRFVWMDTFCTDIDGCYLDGGDDIDEGIAWMPLPKPYRGEQIDSNT